MTKHNYIAQNTFSILDLVFPAVVETAFEA